MIPKSALEYRCFERYMTLSDLAKTVGCSKAHMEGIAARRRSVSFDLAQKIYKEIGAIWIRDDKGKIWF